MVNNHKVHFPKKMDAQFTRYCVSINLASTMFDASFHQIFLGTNQNKFVFLTTTCL